MCLFFYVKIIKKQCGILQCTYKALRQPKVMILIWQVPHNSCRFFSNLDRFRKTCQFHLLWNLLGESFNLWLSKQYLWSFQCLFLLSIVPEPNWPRIECGLHNENGITQNGVTLSNPKVSSQEGEWPHACLIFHKGTFIGGASLIAPKVLVTAAHKLQ